MKYQLVEAFLVDPSESNLDRLFNAEDTVFWVDWREEDDAIVGYCEGIIRSGQLSAEVVEANNEAGFEFAIYFRSTRTIVPLVVGPEDRHITLCTLNELIKPDYEIRFCVQSEGSDTLAFLPLPGSVWGELENRFGDSLREHFVSLQATPNLFTEGYGYVPEPTWQELAVDPKRKVEAIQAYRRQHGCGLSEAKGTIERYMNEL